MNQVKWRGKAGFEDLMRNLASIEEQLMAEHSGIAMDLMVVEAKLREHFQYMEQRMWSNLTLTQLTEPRPDDGLSEADIQALIPRDLQDFSRSSLQDKNAQTKRALKTIAFAAVLAFVTACGVFGVASLVQLFLNWIA